MHYSDAHKKTKLDSHGSQPKCTLHLCLVPIGSPAYVQLQKGFGSGTLQSMTNY
jgi:hypothetical protein